MHMPSGALAGKSLLLLPRTTAAGPSCRLRMIQYLPWLEAAGATVSLSPFFDDRYLATFFRSGRRPPASVIKAYARRIGALRHAARADIVWIEKELFPFLPGAAEGMLARAGVRYVVDLDDAIFHNYDESRSQLVRALLSRKLDPLFRGAAAVTAGNAYLADRARAAGARQILSLPTVVDPSHYPLNVPRPADEALRVGWIGTPANARYLAPVIAALERVAARRPVRLVTIGAPALPGLKIPQERHDWSEEDEGPLLAGIDIGVMPLVDAPWERGKCGYKLIQYMAAGKPVIASPVGVNRDIVTPDIGCLAETVEEWEAAIDTLGADAERRKAMGAEARARVERDFSVEATAPRLVSLFAEILAR